MIAELSVSKLRENISKQRKIINEISSLFNYLKDADTQGEKKMIYSQIESLRKVLQSNAKQAIEMAENVSLAKPLIKEQDRKIGEVNKFAEDAGKVKIASSLDIEAETKLKLKGRAPKRMKPEPLEKLALERSKRKEKIIVIVKEKKPSKYVQISSKTFYNVSNSLIEKGMFKQLKRDLIKANLEFIPATYISVIFFTTLVSFLASFFVAGFFLFFNIVSLPPFIVPVEEGIATRFLKISWIFVMIPASTFFLAYIYPSLEKKSAESKIKQELPFAVIHMSSISSSMIEPSKIFTVIISTGEYPTLEKEFIKLQNEINVYGYDLVTALKNRSFNSPSRKLSELFNGLATTINSGGDLPGFFDKRAQTLLFEHRLDREKQTKASETFMDIYISAVIAAPMILMLLLIMMRISGLGISLSTTMISLIMVLGVSLVNILFLAFLHVKQPEGD